MCTAAKGKLAWPGRFKTRFWRYWHSAGRQGRMMTGETSAPAAPQQDSRREKIAFAIGVAGWLLPGLGHALIEMWGRAGACFLTGGLPRILRGGMPRKAFTSLPTSPLDSPCSLPHLLSRTLS